MRGQYLTDRTAAAVPVGAGRPDWEALLAYAGTMRGRVRWRGLTVTLCAAATATAWAAAPAHACSGGMAPNTGAIPRPGTTNVSTATSLTVTSVGVPWGLTLTAGGQNVPLSAPLSLGNGAAGVAFWQIGVLTPNSMLVGGAEHVLSQTDASGNSVELTRFTAAAGYDKAAGVAPVLRALHLWRVRYPLADIASGKCVFAEYHGFLTVDYDAATVPNTEPTSVIYTFRLTPKNGGAEQRLVHAGDPFVGLAPDRAYPSPIGEWQPELDPTRSYCLTVSAFGDGNLARPPLTSESVCAEVVQLSAPGAPAPPQIGGTGGGGAGGGGAGGGGTGGAGGGGAGTGTAGAGGASAGSGGAGGAGGRSAGAGGAGGGSAGAGAAGGGGGTGGCSTAGPGASGPSTMAALLLVLIAGGRRRRRG